MMIAASVVPGLVGALVGAASAMLHQRAAWRASRALVRSGKTAAVLRGLPARVGLPALALLALARWSPIALLAGLIGFGVVATLTARRLAREGA